jgi:hypothetical protein
MVITSYCNKKIIAINDVATIKIMQLNHTTTNTTVAFRLGIKCYVKELCFAYVTSEPKSTAIIFVSCLIY